MFLKQSLSLFLSCCLLLTTAPGAFADQADQSDAPPPVQAAQQTPAQLQQLVAPIALYPDALVAQILAAATYPDQIVEADRWLQQHTDLKGEQLGQEVDKQPWDPSVKALAEFPSVLANMDKNLSWTSSLGDAYVNQQQDVMNAVQVMRDRAEKAGNLKSTSQEKVSKQGQTIVIEPANPQVVYVPEYDPGSCMESPSGLARLVFVSGTVPWRVRELRLASALESASLAGLAGDGTTGDLTGITTDHLQPQHLHIPQQNLRQSQHLQSRAREPQSWWRISWWKRISGPRPWWKSGVPWISPAAWIRSPATRIRGAACSAWWSFRRIRRL